MDKLLIPKYTGTIPIKRECINIRIIIYSLVLLCNGKSQLTRQPKDFKLGINRENQNQSATVDKQCKQTRIDQNYSSYQDCGSLLQDINQNEVIESSFRQDTVRFDGSGMYKRCRLLYY